MPDLALDPLAFVALGLATSLHCVFMCGGLVLAYAVRGRADGPWYRRLAPHLAYHGAKTISYAAVAVAIGAAVGVLGRGLDIAVFRDWVMVVAGLYMVLLGISLTGRFPALRYLTPRPSKSLVAALSRNRRRAAADDEAGHASLTTPLVFGLLTGLMPCAPLIAAQAAAASSGSPLAGAALMASFGLGTAPLMLAFGFASSWLSRAFRERLQGVAALAVILFGVVLLSRGLTLVGSPVTFETVRTAVIGAASGGGGFTVAADGVAEVAVAIEDTRFVPQTVSVPAGRPVRLVVDRREAASCSDRLAVPQLGVLHDLKPLGVTRVDVPATPAGSYTLTCGMGMMTGSLAVGAGGTALPWQALPVAIAAVAAAVVAAVLSRRRIHS